MPQKKPYNQRKDGKQSGWNPEESFDNALTLEELINSPPFNDAGGGTSHQMAARVPQWLARRAIEFVESKGTPYKIASDAYRDAVYLGMRVLSVRYKSNPKWEAEARMAKAVDNVGTIKRVKKQVEELASGLDELVSSGDTRQALIGLEDYLAPVIEIEDGWYRSKVVTFLSEHKVTRNLIDKLSPQMKSTLKGIIGESEREGGRY